MMNYEYLPFARRRQRLQRPSVKLTLGRPLPMQHNPDKPPAFGKFLIGKRPVFRPADRRSSPPNPSPPAPPPNDPRESHISRPPALIQPVSTPPHYERPGTGRLIRPRHIAGSKPPTAYPWGCPSCTLVQERIAIWPSSVGKPSWRNPVTAAAGPQV